MGKVLQKELFRQGLTDLTSHVVVDTVPMTSYIGHVSAYNAMSKVMPSSSRGTESEKKLTISGKFYSIKSSILQILNHKLTNKKKQLDFFSGLKSF